MLKPEVARNIMQLLNIPIENADSSEDQASGGGGTVTKYALEKILNEVKGLLQKVENLENDN